MTSFLSPVFSLNRERAVPFLNLSFANSVMERQVSSPLSPNGFLISPNLTNSILLKFSRKGKRRELILAVIFLIFAEALELQVDPAIGIVGFAGDRDNFA